MYPFSILCMLVFILLPTEHLSVYRWIQQSCRIKQRTATFLLWGMQRWRGAARTLHMGWRSGRGHSETLSWATCAEVVKCARGVLHSVSLAVSISQGGQRPGGSSGLSDPTTSRRHKPVWLCAARSWSKKSDSVVFFSVRGCWNDASIKPSPVHS